MLECIYFFVIGAFLGWLLECVFKFVTRNFARAPGILNTPFCILYGFGTLTLSMVINRLTNRFWVTFVLSFLILTTMEYITYILLAKVYYIRLWDYSDMKFKFNEKVCFEFSLIWGLLGALYIKYLLPFLTNIYNIVKGKTLATSLYFLLAVIIMDFVISSYIIITKNREHLIEDA